LLTDHFTPSVTIGADRMGVQGYGPPQKFGCGTLLWLGPPQRFRGNKFNIIKIVSRVCKSIKLSKSLGRWGFTPDSQAALGELTVLLRPLVGGKDNIRSPRTPPSQPFEFRCFRPRHFLGLHSVLDGLAPMPVTIGCR